MAVYQRSYQRRCTSRTTETGDRPKSCGPLTPAQIADLLTFVLRSTYFQYNGSIFEQREGSNMGSPVTAVIANLYMESFQQQTIICTSSYKPRIWKRRPHLRRQYLKNQQSSIRITMETENENNSPTLTLHFQENRKAAPPPAYTGSLRTLISTSHMIHTVTHACQRGDSHKTSP